MPSKAWWSPYQNLYPGPCRQTPHVRQEIMKKAKLAPCSINSVAIHFNFHAATKDCQVPVSPYSSPVSLCKHRRNFCPRIPKTVPETVSRGLRLLLEWSWISKVHRKRRSGIREALGCAQPFKGGFGGREGGLSPVCGRFLVRSPRQTDRQAHRVTCIHMYTHTHTHLYLHIYLYVYLHTYVYVEGGRDGWMDG